MAQIYSPPRSGGVDSFWGVRGLSVAVNGEDHPNSEAPVAAVQVPRADGGSSDSFCTNASQEWHGPLKIWETHLLSLTTWLFSNVVLEESRSFPCCDSSLGPARIK